MTKTKKRLPKSIRIHIRRQKKEIREKFLTLEEQNREIKKLYEK